MQEVDKPKAGMAGRVFAAGTHGHRREARGRSGFSA
jgi:hypothetical protein